MSITTDVVSEEPRLWPISMEGKWGYIDETGKVVIEPQFVSAGNFSEGLAVVGIAGTSDEDRLFKRTFQGFIGPDGEFVIPPEPPPGVREMEEYQFYSYGDFREGLARIHVNDASGMDGYIDRTGKLVIQPKYDTSGHFSEGLVYARTWRAWDDPGPQRKGFINTLGEFVIEDETFSYSCPFSEGRACVTIEPEDEGLIDGRGNYVIPPGDYSAISSPVAGAIRVVKDGKVGLVDRDGAVVVPLGFYDQILEPVDGRVFAAERKGKAVLIDASGKRLAEVAEAGEVGQFQNGMATIEQDGRYGYIDATGAVRIPAQFDTAEAFRHGLALVTIGGTHGYIDVEGIFIWKTDRWEPIRNSVREPLSTYLPDTAVEALPLSYNWDGVENAIVFVADGSLAELRAWYKKRCPEDLELKDSTDFEAEPGKIALAEFRPGESDLEVFAIWKVFAIDGTAEEADYFVEFYSCGNMTELREKYPEKIVGILIEN